MHISHLATHKVIFLCLVYSGTSNTCTSVIQQHTQKALSALCFPVMVLNTILGYCLQVQKQGKVELPQEQFENAEADPANRQYVRNTTWREHTHAQIVAKYLT
jgi:hypothetical protein